MNSRRTCCLLALFVTLGVAGVALGAEEPQKRRFFNPDTFAFLTLLGDDPVREMLLLNEEQRTAIDGILAEWSMDFQQANETAAPGDREAGRALARKLDAHERKALDLLGPDQRKQVSRLHRLKRAAQFTPTSVIGDKEEELHLTDAQRAAVAEVDAAWNKECERLDGELLEDWEKPFFQQEFAMRIMEQSDKFEAILNDRLEQILQPEQWRRWTELQWQDEAQLDGPAILLRPELAQDLRLTPDQEEHLEGIVKAAEREASALSRKGDYFAVMRLRLARLREAIAELGPEQRRQAEAILGEPHGWFKDLWEGRDPQPSVETR